MAGCCRLLVMHLEDYDYDLALLLAPRLVA